MGHQMIKSLDIFRRDEVAASLRETIEHGYSHHLKSIVRWEINDTQLSPFALNIGPFNWIGAIVRRAIIGDVQ